MEQGRVVVLEGTQGSAFWDQCRILLALDDYCRNEQYSMILEVLLRFAAYTAFDVEI
jgi:hypothetical protein